MLEYPTHRVNFEASMPATGVEPARPNGHRILSPGCLPIPPHRLKRDYNRSPNGYSVPIKVATLERSTFLWCSYYTHALNITVCHVSALLLIQPVLSRYFPGTFPAYVLWRVTPCPIRDNLLHEVLNKCHTRLNDDRSNPHSRDSCCFTSSPAKTRLHSSLLSCLNNPRL